MGNFSVVQLGVFQLGVGSCRFVSLTTSDLRFANIVKPSRNSFHSFNSPIKGNGEFYELSEINDVIST